MPTKWLEEIRETGRLKVHNKAGGWMSAVDGAIATFNRLNMGVTLVKEKEERAAHIVVMLSSGSETYDHPDTTLVINFPADKLHGRAKTLEHPRRAGLYFALVLLPGKVKNPTPRQKEVIIVHELIHAAGLDGGIPGGGKDPNGDHDIVGVMVGQMVVVGDGVLEMLPEKGAKPMSPIRVGAQTLCKMRMIWQGESC